MTAPTILRPARRPRQGVGGAGQRRAGLAGLAFVLPGFALYALVMLYPTVQALLISLRDYNIVPGASSPWIGLDHYQRALEDPVLRRSFLNAVFYTAVTVPAQVVIGLFLALLLWSGARGSLIFRTVYFLPFILSLVVVAIAWQWIFHPLFGPLNKLLDSVGLEQLSRGWLGDPTTALYAVLISAIPGATGLVVVILFAALQNVDVSQVEAAKIDGANWFQRAWYIVIPGIAPVITMVTAITLIGGFAVFDNVFVMTGGDRDTPARYWAPTRIR